jgi:hypothetical protein
MDIETYETLLEVRRLLIEEGHIGGMNHLEGRGYCLMGALNQATNVSQRNCSYNSYVHGRWEIRLKLIHIMKKKLHVLGIDCGLEGFNDRHRKNVIPFLNELIQENEPKGMEIGKPEKQYTIEPAEPIPGVKEQPAPTPTPVPVAPEREKVPA